MERCLLQEGASGEKDPSEQLVSSRESDNTESSRFTDNLRIVFIEIGLYLTHMVFGNRLPGKQLKIAKLNYEAAS